MTTATTTLDTFSAIETRRSVKHFDPSFAMPETDLNKLIELSMLSPTSFNMQNWRFLCVTDQAIKDQLCAVSWNQAHVKEASVVVILCADLKAAEKDPQRYWRNAPESAQAQIVPMIPKFYKDNLELQKDEGHRSCGMAGQTLMLAAKAMGYDSCPMIGYDPVKVAEIVNLPEDHMLSFMVVVGKAKDPAQPRGGQLSRDEVMFKDTF